MEITLEKIDTIRERTGVSYKEAKEALQACNGEVVDALVYLEQAQKEGKWTETITVAGSEVVDKVKDLIRKGNIAKIRIKKDDKVLLDIPVTAGAIGTLLAPQLAAIGTVVALISKCTLEIERANKETVNLNKMMGQKAEHAMEIVEDLAEDAKGFVGELSKKVKKDDDSIDNDEEI